jgi:hypothetical protein
MTTFDLFQISSIEYRLVEIMNKLNSIENRVKGLEEYLKKGPEYLDDEDLPAFLRPQAE